jgi:hypothetical protein
MADLKKLINNKDVKDVKDVKDNEDEDEEMEISEEVIESLSHSKLNSNSKLVIMLKYVLTIYVFY